MREDRRRRLAISALACALLLTAIAVAKRGNVPIQLQSKLTAKIASYDRNMAERVSSGARVLVLQHANSNSQRLARRIQSALRDQPSFAGAKLRVDIQTFSTAAALAERVESDKIAMVYFAGSFDSYAREIQRALKGVSVLTVTTELSAVRKGIVLGLGLISGRPKLYLNLPQAHAQHVQIAPRLLKLMVVYR